MRCIALNSLFSSAVSYRWNVFTSGSNFSLRQEGPRAQDRCEGRGMAGGLALPWVAAPQLRSAATHPRTAGLDPLSAQTGGKLPSATAIAEAAGDGQHQDGERGLRCFRSLRPLDAV